MVSKKFSFRIGLVTCEEEPDLWDDDALLLKSLKESGVPCEPVIWSDQRNNYKNYDILVIRSVWDYHYKYKEFLNWLALLENNNTRVFNSVDALRENSNKIYLANLQKLGIPLVPSAFFKSEDASLVVLPELFERFKCKELVIKPFVGASSYQVEKIDQNTDFNLFVYCQKNPCGFIVQKFIPEVFIEGEISLIYLNGIFSHAVRKKPKQGDFRVQDDYGGTFEYIDPNIELRQKVDKIMRNLQPDLLYARIDCLWTKNLFYLMEVELVEPILYLHDPRCRQQFIEALIKRCIGGTDF